MLIPHFIGFAFAATFTGSQPADEFPNFHGNRDNLNTLLKIFGSVSDRFDRQGATFDAIFSDELLSMTMRSFSDLKFNYLKFGMLLEDLNPERFDLLCSTITVSKIDPTQMVYGYSNEASKWKAASRRFPDAKSLSETLLATIDCGYYAQHPHEILTFDCAKKCIELWLGEEKYEAIRKILSQSPWFRFLKMLGTKAYVGHESEFVQMFCKTIPDQGAFWYRQITLPDFINVSHIQPLVQLARTRSWPHALEIESESNDQELQNLLYDLNKEIMERDPVFDEVYIDSEDFLGRWALPKRLYFWARNRAPQVCNLNQAFPRSISSAFNSLYIYGNDEILKNTLSLLGELVIDCDLHVQRQYYEFIAQPYIYSPQLKQMAMLVKPFLKSLPAQWQVYWHLRPLYRQMDANPSDFWPTELLAEGTNWVKEQLKAVALNEKEIIEAIESKKLTANASLWALGPSEPSWKKLRLLVDGSRSEEIINKIACVTKYMLFTFAGYHKKNPDECHSMLMEEMDTIIPAVAMSANFKLLAVLLKSLKPHEILSNTTNGKIRNRIALMMHLDPKVESFHGRVKVNKNSIFFRNWVMLHFPVTEGQRTADLKLLFYYFWNRCLGLYDGFDIFNLEENGNHMVFGLLNEPGTECRRSNNRNWDLTFEPTGPIVEDRKRSREGDDENSPNKRQKTEQ